MMNQYTTLFERAGARFEDPQLPLARVLRRRDRKRMRRRIWAAVTAVIVVGLVGGAAAASYLRSAPESRPAGDDLPPRHDTVSPNGRPPRHRKVSPDGSHVAFADAGWIWVSSRDGSGRLRVAPGYEFAWSPDSTRIATHVESGSPGGSWQEEIWVVTTDGSDLVSILPSDCCLDGIVDKTLRWSHDGTRVAFMFASVSDRFHAVMADGSDAGRSSADLPSIDASEWRSW